MGDKGFTGKTWMEAKDDVESRLMNTAPSSTYSIETPDGGKVYSFDPDTATVNQLMDFVATLSKDIMG